MPGHDGLPQRQHDAENQAQNGDGTHAPHGRRALIEARSATAHEPPDSPATEATVSRGDGGGAGHGGGAGDGAGGECGGRDGRGARGEYGA